MCRTKKGKKKILYQRVESELDNYCMAPCRVDNVTQRERVRTCKETWSKVFRLFLSKADRLSIDTLISGSTLTWV
jgi:hypothetical protein